MPEVREVVETGDELWFAAPPGWIELAAHVDDDAARAWFDRLLAQTPDAFDAEQTARLHEIFQQTRRSVPDTGLDSAGVLITTLEDDRMTAWQFSIAVLDMPPSGDANVMAVIERYLGSESGRAPLGPDDIVESFQTEDGRDGVAIHTTLASEEAARIAANIPGADAERLGVVYAAVRLNRPKVSDHDRVFVLVAVAPTPEERLAMAVVAASIVLSARLRDGDADRLPGRVDLDTTGHRRDETEPVP